MVQLTIHAKRDIKINGAIAAVFALLEDVPVSGKMFPGVDAIADEGEGRYDWELAERKTLGHTFKGKYKTLHENNGKDEVRWRTIEGNLQTKGEWLIRGRDGAVNLFVEVESTVEVPIPRIIKKPAQIFAQAELSNGLVTQLEKIKAAVEK